MKRLYIETTYIAGVMFGQDDDANAILPQATAIKAEVCVPMICIFESMALFENERRRRNELRDRANAEIKKISRDVSNAARRVTTAFEEAKLANDALFNDIQRRLNQALQSVLQLTLLPITSEVINRALNDATISDLTDNLILHCVTADAEKRRDAETSAFFTRNSTDFDTLEVRELLQNADSDLLLGSAEVLQWLR